MTKGAAVIRLSKNLQPIFEYELSQGNEPAQVDEVWPKSRLVVWFRYPLHVEEIERDLQLAPTVERYEEHETHYALERGYADEETTDAVTGPISGEFHSDLRTWKVIKELPEGLRRAVERAYASLLLQSDYALKPSERVAIYRVLDGLCNKGVGAPSRMSLARRWLGILAARHVLPVWQIARPLHPMPEDVLAVAEGLLRGSVSEDEAQRALGEAWERLEHLGRSGSGEKPEPGPGLFYVASAAVQALREASGKDPFVDEPPPPGLLSMMSAEQLEAAASGRAIIREEDTDDDLDEWSSDTAKWAASAAASAVWEPQFDLQKSRAFWTWWVLGAVPSAWRMAQASTDAESKEGG